MATEDVAATVLGRLGLTSDLDTFQSLVVLLDGSQHPARYVACVALIGTLMLKAAFPRALVSLVVRELIKAGPALLDTPNGGCSVVSFEGTSVFIPGANIFYDIQTLKPAIPPNKESLTATVFSIRRAYEVCEGIE